MHRWLSEDSDDVTPYDSHSSPYSVSKRQLSVQRALIDRGANGTVGGSDCTWIGGPVIPKSVSITGIDNHQLNNIPIGTVGALCNSNRGPVICIFNEVAYTGKYQSIISSIQLEHYHNQVNDTAILKTGTQAQRITTADGYIFGLSIKSGLAYLKMRPFTAQEYESLPHVIMTSDKKWDPSIFDSDNEPTDESFPPDLDQLPTKDYDVQGEYIRAHHIKNNHDDDSFTDDDIFEDAVQTMDEDFSLDPFWIPEHEYNHLQTIQRCIHSAVQDTNSYSISNSDVSELKSSTQPRTHRPSPIDYKKLQPYFAWLPIQMIKDTFQNSTQYGFVPSYLPMEIFSSDIILQIQL